MASIRRAPSRAVSVSGPRYIRAGEAERSRYRRPWRFVPSGGSGTRDHPPRDPASPGCITQFQSWLAITSEPAAVDVPAGGRRQAGPLRGLPASAWGCRNGLCSGSVPAPHRRPRSASPRPWRDPISAFLCDHSSGLVVIGGWPAAVFGFAPLPCSAIPTMPSKRTSCASFTRAPTARGHDAAFALTSATTSRMCSAIRSQSSGSKVSGRRMSNSVASTRLVCGNACAGT